MSSPVLRSSTRPRGPAASPAATIPSALIPLAYSSHMRDAGLRVEGAPRAASLPDHDVAPYGHRRSTGGEPSGPGAFHRAHRAVFTEHAAARPGGPRASPRSRPGRPRPCGHCVTRTASARTVSPRRSTKRRVRPGDGLDEPADHPPFPAGTGRGGTHRRRRPAEREQQGDVVPHRRERRATTRGGHRPDAGARRFCVDSAWVPRRFSCRGSPGRRSPYRSAASRCRCRWRSTPPGVRCRRPGRPVCPWPP